MTAVNTVDVLWASIVSWNHPDQLIRIKNRKNQPAFNFLHWDSHGQVIKKCLKKHCVPFNNIMLATPQILPDKIKNATD